MRKGGKGVGEEERRQKKKRGEVIKREGTEEKRDRLLRKEVRTRNEV